MAHEGEGDTAKVGTSSEAGDDGVGIFTRHFHLLFGFQSDDGLVQGHVAQYGAEGIFAVGSGLCQLYGFGNGCSQRALIVGMGGQYIFSGAGRHGGRRGNLRTECLHDAAAVGLLLVTDFYLIDSGFQSEEAGGICQGSSPLSGTGFGGHVSHSLLLAIVCLWDGGVQLVRAHRADALVLEVDMCRCAERFLQSISAHQRSAAVVFVHFADLFGDFNPRVSLIQFLAAEFLGKDGIQVFCFQRLLGAGVKRWHGLVHHIGLYVIPVLWDCLFRENESFLFVAHSG